MGSPMLNKGNPVLDEEAVDSPVGCEATVHARRNRVPDDRDRLRRGANSGRCRTGAVPGDDTPNDEHPAIGRTKSTAQSDKDQTSNGPRG